MKSVIYLLAVLSNNSLIHTYIHRTHTHTHTHTQTHTHTHTHTHNGSTRGDRAPGKIARSLSNSLKCHNYSTHTPRATWKQTTPPTGLSTSQEQLEQKEQRDEKRLRGRDEPITRAKLTGHRHLTRTHTHTHTHTLIINIYQYM